MSRMESEKLQVPPMELRRLDEGGQVLLTTTKQSLRVSALQMEMLEFLVKNHSLEDLTRFYLNRNQLPSFRELYGLIERLTREGVILNRSFRDYFADQDAPPHLDWNTLRSSATLALNTFKELPFFRSLKPELSELFHKKSIVYQIGPRVRLCSLGQKSRDLFVLLSGEAGIYRPTNAKSLQLIAKLHALAVFGEGGFLLNHPRSADVISWSDCTVLRIPYSDEFASLIQGGKAETLQKRFWVLHALGLSPLFKNIPSESLDEMTFAGTFQSLKRGELLFQEGSQGSSFFILVQGQLSIRQGGREINRLHQGSCLGEIALLLHQGRRSASVTAEADSLLLEISAPSFYELLARNLRLAQHLETIAHERLANDVK